MRFEIWMLALLLVSIGLIVYGLSTLITRTKEFADKAVLYKQKISMT